MNASGSSNTYNSARGLFRGHRSGLLSTSHTELSAMEAFAFLDASASKSMEAALFFLPPAGDPSSFSSSSSLEAEQTLEPSDIVSEVPRRRRPPRIFLASFSAVFFGTL